MSYIRAVSLLETALIILLYVISCLKTFIENDFRFILFAII